MKLKFLIIVILFTSSIYSQKKYFKDDLANIVVYVADIVGQNLRGLGTASVISDSNKYYLLTASHVSDSIKGNCIIIFRVANDKPIAIPLSKFVGKNKSAWVKHIEADLSFIEIYPYDTGSDNRLREWSFPINQISDKREAISRDFDVVSIGFPLIDMIGTHFSPLTFNSYFSSGLLTLKRADTKTLSTFQVLENPSVQGYSGGPVFVGVKKDGVVVGPKQTQLAGIVHGTFSDNTGGKIAMITPSYYVLDLIK
ncbi:serine protease family protein [Ferruginibacter sp.]